MRRQPREYLLPRDDAPGRPFRCAADVHVFDEPHLGLQRPAELDQIDELVVVDAADDHRVDLEGAEHAMRGGHPFEDAIELVEAGEGLEPVAAERVEAHRDSAEPGPLQPVDLVGQQDAVRGQRKVGQARLGGEQLDQHVEVAAEQRFAAGQPETIDAQADEHVHERADFLEVQHVLAGQPHVVLLRHAVFAAEVAAVGDRQPQVLQRTAQLIKH